MNLDHIVVPLWWYLRLIERRSLVFLEGVRYFQFELVGRIVAGNDRIHAKCRVAHPLVHVAGGSIRNQQQLWMPDNYRLMAAVVKVEISCGHHCIICRQGLVSIIIIAKFGIKIGNSGRRLGVWYKCFKLTRNPKHMRVGDLRRLHQQHSSRQYTMEFHVPCWFVFGIYGG